MISRRNDRLRNWFSIRAAALFFALLGSPSYAGLIIDANIKFDLGAAAINFFDDASQGGAFFVEAGGVQTTSTFSGAVVPVSESEELIGSLTEVGDGIGFNVTANAKSEAGGSGGGFEVQFNATLSVSNNSLTDTYEVIFKSSFDGLVDADGVDAYADSRFELDLTNPTDSFLSSIVSDTTLGDFRDDVETGNSGEELRDSGMPRFSLTLAPGESQVLEIDYLLVGGAFESISSSVGSFESVTEIQSITNLTQSSHLVPEPSTFVAGLGVISIAVFRRVPRSRKRRR
ncbi:MAG: hypothetical protein P8L85_24580 [Rubripirellula sp.]|nr:hypothetical protein [Rubripirellula sp.]